MSRTVWHEMVRHCLEERPMEACGLLSGRNGCAETLWRMENIEKSPVAFAMDLRHVQKVLQKMALKGETLAGIYHSHPTAPPLPSLEDIAYAHYPEAAYLIVSLSSSEPVIGCYRIVGTRVFSLPYSLR
ncbi:Mov34/MPN/PAD-1 family protein [Brevibacillus sp. GCM10020057]|uniref:Mov34/MPN/PAD-1 family protein n=1 Tax=Brevibacillus sp. GCM10020057 TaxID=3317327 RepID=UPI00364223DA